MPAGGRYVPGASHRSCFYPSLQSRNPGTDKRVVSHRAKTHVEGETEIFDDGGDGPGGDDEPVVARPDVRLDPIKLDRRWKSYEKEVRRQEKEMERAIAMGTPQGFKFAALAVGYIAPDIAEQLRQLKDEFEKELSTDINQHMSVMTKFTKPIFVELYSKEDRLEKEIIWLRGVNMNGLK